jgi:thioredoxin 1
MVLRIRPRIIILILTRPKPHYSGVSFMKPVTISESQFEKEVINSKTPVLVDFYAEWCQPCKVLDKVLNSIGERKNGSLKIVKLDVMSAQTVAGNYMVQTLPTTILFRDGQIVSALEGLQKTATYEDLLDPL